MDWNDLRYFLTIARAGTLMGAARQLGVEHTTVGRRLASLESALGAKLFVRGPSGLSLTDAGSEILPCVEAIAGQIDAIERRVAGGDARVEGLVRVTIPEAVNAYLVQQLAALYARHAGLVIELLSDNRETDLRRGEADVAVRFRDSTDADLVTRKIGSAGWALYASPAYLARRGAPPADLRGHDVIGFDASLANVHGAKWLRDHARDANIVLRGNSLAAVANAVSVGLGVGALPCFIARDYSELQRVSAEIIGTRDIVLAVHPDLAQVARVRATMDFLIEVFARDAAIWSGR